MTPQQQRIEHVAACIYEGGLLPGEARQQNAGEGWCYDVRWVGVPYLGDGGYTRVEGDRLSGADLERAMDLAAAWIADRV